MEMKAAASREAPARSRMRRWALKQVPEDHTYSAEDQGAEPIATSGETEEDSENEMEVPDEKPATKKRAARKTKKPASAKKATGKGAKQKKQAAAPKSRKRKNPSPKKALEEVEEAEGDEEVEDEEAALALLKDADEAEDEQVDEMASESESDMDEGADNDMAQVLMRWRESKNAARPQTEGMDADDQEVDEEVDEDEEEEEMANLEYSDDNDTVSRTNQQIGHLNSSGDTERLTSSSGSSGGRHSRAGKTTKRLSKALQLARAKEPEAIRASSGVIRQTSASNRQQGAQTRRQRESEQQQQSEASSTAESRGANRLDEIIAMFKQSNSSSSSTTETSETRRPHPQQRQAAKTQVTGSSKRKRN